MADFDYGNARLRARMAGMLTHQTFSMLAQSPTLQIFISGLSKTPYRKSIERAQTQISGISLLESILSEEVYASVQQLLKYYDGIALEQIKIILAYEDMQNLKIILRGIQKGAQEMDINGALLQWGNTSPVFLRNVAASKSMEEAVASLAILGNDAAKALSALTSEQLAHSAEVDYELEKWFFYDVLIESARKTSDHLLFYYRMRSDIFDILSICAKFLIPNLFEGKDVNRYLLGKGNIPGKILNRSAVRPNLKQAIISLQRTPYFASLRYILDRNTPVTLVGIDKRLQGFLWDWVRRQPHRDPLGIGVPIGFIHKKKREIECLRYIADSIQLGLQPDCVLENMEIPE